jgi:hypothetical protein
VLFMSLTLAGFTPERNSANKVSRIDVDQPTGGTPSARRRKCARCCSAAST